MATITVRVCDTCESQTGVETWEVKRGREKASIDLCGDHSDTLEDMFTRGRVTRIGGRQPATKTVAKKGAPRGGRKASGVMSLDEIEKMKKN